MFTKAKYVTIYFILAILFVTKSFAEPDFNGFDLPAGKHNISYDSSAPQNAWVNASLLIPKLNDSVFPASHVDYKDEKYLSELSNIETEYNQSQNSTTALI